MEKEKKNLYVFGYGLALLIPLIVVLHSIDHGLNIWVVLGMFVLVMFIITKMALIKPVWNIWALLAQLYAFTLGVKHGYSAPALLLLGLAILILLATQMKLELIRHIYAQWMKAAHFIGTTVMGLMLSLMFYLIFGTTGIVLRLLKKDLLNEKLEPQKESYWIKRTKNISDKKYYENQF